MKPNVPKISDSEWVVMKELWRSHPRTAGQVVESLTGKTSWGPATVKTLINRLVTKKALAFVKQGREYLYSPIASEADCVRAESSSFLHWFNPLVWTPSTRCGGTASWPATRRCWRGSPLPRAPATAAP